MRFFPFFATCVTCPLLAIVTVKRPFDSTKLPPVCVRLTAVPLGVGHDAVVGMPESRPFTVVAAVELALPVPVDPLGPLDTVDPLPLAADEPAWLATDVAPDAPGLVPLDTAGPVLSGPPFEWVPHAAIAAAATARIEARLCIVGGEPGRWVPCDLLAMRRTRGSITAGPGIMNLELARCP
jgi:hypothetical protein